MRDMRGALLIGALALGACGEGPTQGPGEPSENPAPAAAGLSPSSVEAGSAAFPLTVTGSGFVADSRVHWQGSERPTTFVSASRLRAQISAADVASAGQLHVRVVTPAPGGGTSAPLVFTVREAAPGPVASVELDVDSLSLDEGATRQLTATARDAAGREITGLGTQWSSDAEGVVHVGALGLVTAVRSGRAVVRVRVHGQEAEAVVRVTADYGYDLVYSAGPVGGAASPRWLDLGDPTAASTELDVPGVEPGVVVASPDGRRLAFVAETALQGAGIYVSDVDGGGLAQVAPLRDGGCGQIAWRPDGAMLAYVCGFTAADQNVLAVDVAAGATPVVLTTGQDGRESWPSWSPLQADGSWRIAYARTVAGEPRVFTMREDGGDVRQITSGMDDQPSWSPDGTKIVFVRTGAAIFGDLWLVDANGGNERALMPAVPLAGPQQQPSWSPDGRLIAFLSRHDTYGTEGSIDQLFTVWADGTKVAKRTTDELIKGTPSWIRR